MSVIDLVAVISAVEVSVEAGLSLAMVMLSKPQVGSRVPSWATKQTSPPKISQRVSTELVVLCVQVKVTVSPNKLPVPY